MPSPDLTPYVDLTLFDLTADQLAALATAVMADRFPGWVPRTGNTEVLLIEAAAELAAQQVYAINRVPGAVLESLLRLYGLDRSQGVAATTTITVNVVDSIGRTIPAGTLFRLPLGDLGDPVDFATDVDLVIAPGSSSGTVAATATTAGVTPNGIPAATAVTSLSSATILSARLASTVAGGQDPEDGPAFLARGSQRLRRLTDTLVLPDHFAAAALEIPAVYRARAVNLWNADTSTTATGHLTVAVLGVDGATLSGPQLTAIDDALTAQAIALLEVHVRNATVTAVDVAAQFVTLPGFPPSDVESAVLAALAAYLNPNTWGWSDTVRRNELVSLVDGVAGVDYVIDILDGVAGDPIADIALTGIANLVAAGDLNADANPA